MKFDYSVQEPLNREPPVDELISSFYTEKGAYDRNHGPIPHLDADTHIVHVDGAVENKLALSIAQLKNEFKQHDVVCCLQCAGNRRHTMRTLLKEVDGIDWGDGAVMNCKWRGPKLKDVLDRAGPKIPHGTKGHVAFASFQTECQDDTWYGGSIELERALRDDADVVLALEMNGKTLPVNNGYPVRMVVPGIAGARSVKWLDRITVQLEESKNFYQTHDYKVLPPDAVDKESASKYWDVTPAVQEMPVNSVIAVPQSGKTATLSPNGTIEVRGYALPSGNGGPVAKVEVSVDDGKTWVGAEIVNGLEARSKWAWVLWKATVKLERGEERRIFSRATDVAGQTQCAQPQWNFRGVCYNGYGESRDITVA
ncbi:MAG: sulfite oxidase [Lasallia pustulata]|uniref:Sulfite oxidase n=1 Tax=Lasallia pustulata TaxID=136370 RepID=A0A5M8PC69_9LECA|nr:MAG: sulfite oxidase [Lasallia pustulata]